MSYVIDDAIVSQLDEEMREPSEPLGGGGRIVGFQEVARWLAEAADAQETALEKLDELARETGQALDP